MIIGILSHAIDFVVGESGRLFDGHGLFLGGTQVLCRNVENTILIDVELDFDLWHAAGRGWNAF